MLTLRKTDSSYSKPKKKPDSYKVNNKYCINYLSEHQKVLNKWAKKQYARD